MDRIRRISDGCSLTAVYMLCPSYLQRATIARIVPTDRVKRTHWEVNGSCASIFEIHHVYDVGFA